MNTVIIAVAVLAVIALLASAGIMCYVIGRNRTRKRRKNQSGRVFVRQGIDVKKQMPSDGKGEYFAGGREEPPTCLADPALRTCRLWLDNQHTGETLCAEFASQIWIGREKTGGNMLVIRGDSKISRKHCVIFQSGNSLYLQDMNSSNHTYLNGRRITEASALRNGDVIRVGDTEMRVRYMTA